MENKTPHPILAEIEAFLVKADMGATYFGKRAVGNSELVRRLRAGRDILTSSEKRIRTFMEKRLAEMGSAS